MWMGWSMNVPVHRSHYLCCMPCDWAHVNLAPRGTSIRTTVPRSILLESVANRRRARQVNSGAPPRAHAIGNGEEHRFDLTDQSVRVDLENLVDHPGPGRGVSDSLR